MKYLALFGTLTVIASFAFLQQPRNNKRQSFDAKIGDVPVSLEVANTSTERERGLMYRKHLPEKHGMIFIFPDERNRTFWMKNTYIPLDIIFVDANKTIVDIDRATPQPNISKENLKLYRSERSAKYVIEMKKGFTERNNISEGSKIFFGGELVNCCIKLPKQRSQTPMS